MDLARFIWELLGVLIELFETVVLQATENSWWSRGSAESGRLF